MSDAAIPPSPSSAAGRRRSSPAIVRTLRFRSAQVGLAFMLLVLAIALLGPLVAPHSPTEYVGPTFAKPSGDYLLGTDALGRDVLSRVMNGGRSILWLTTASTLLGVGIGTVMGLFAGYVPSLDNLLMRPLELIQTFPGLLLILLFVALLGTQTWLLIVLIALGQMPSVARVVRGMTLDIATRDFVAAAEGFGCSRRHILMREVLPNIATPLLVQFGIYLTIGLTVIASLSFIGFGQQPPAVDWGLMTNENQAALAIQPWAIFAPTIMIALFAIGATLLTEGYARTIARVDRIETS